MFVVVYCVIMIIKEFESRITEGGKKGEKEFICWLSPLIALMARAVLG